MIDHKGAGALVSVVLALAVPAVAQGSGRQDVLGLPPLANAQRDNLSPASRTLRPIAVTAQTPVDDDFVQAGATVSETSAHDLDAGTSSTATTDGVTVRKAGSGVAGGWFSYAMRVAAAGPTTVRVEEAGSATSDYRVVIDGATVYRRLPDPRQSGTWDGMDGLVHYEFTIPAAIIRRAHRVGAQRRIRIAFRNADQPGDGAEIASVWTISPRGRAVGARGGTVTDAAGATTAGGATFAAHVLGRPFAIYDFGREVGGQVQMTIDNPGPATTLGLAFSESEMYMTTASDFSEDPAGVATETHYISVPTGITHLTDPVIRGGFRWLMAFPAQAGELRISDLRLYFTPAPTMANLRAYRGAFASGSPTLDHLWYAGAYTVQTDTINPTTGRAYPATPGEVQNNATVASGPTALTDGAKRDRLDWIGDQSVEDPVAYLSTGDTLSALDSFQFMARAPAPDGEVPGIYLPSSGYNYGWGEYAAWFIREYWDYYLYTGDRAFLNRWYPTVAGDIAWFQSLQDPDGLLDISSAGGQWGYGGSGEETYDNALYVEVLKDAVAAAGVEGDAAQAAAWTADGQRVATAINAHLWDPSTGAYIVAPGDGAHPQDGNVLALLSGVATGNRAADVLTFLRSQLTPYGPDDIDQSGNVVAQYVSPFITYYELLAEADQGTTASTDEAMTILDRTWDTMLQPGYSGDMWENISLSGAPQLGAYTSLSHGWSAGVVPFLTNEVLGVQPTSGGFATFSVLPHVPSTLPWAEGRVPTPAGFITAGWRRDARGLTEQVNAPPGETYTVGVPDDAANVTADGRQIWHDGHATAPGVSDSGGEIQLAGASGMTIMAATR